MIYTITLNPAIDKTIIKNNFEINQVNRIDEVREDAGGKGINVSKMIKNLNGESIALGLLGGRQGEFIKKQLDEMHIESDFLFRRENTRTNLKIVDYIKHTYTDLNEVGIPVSEETLYKLEHKIFSLVKEDDIIVIAGSVPLNINKDIYRRWILKAKNQKCKVILDADGELLRQGIKAGPYLVKPNIHELEKLFNKKIKSTKEVIECGKILLDYGIKLVVVSRGSDGCIAITDTKVIFAEALDVEVKSTVGAGDSMVGALSFAIHNQLPLNEAVALGVASSSASIQLEGTEMGKIETVIELKNRVIITEGE